MSPKKGRPKVEKPKTVNYSIRLDNDMETKLLEYCYKNGITKGEAIRRGILLMLTNEKADC